MANDRNLRVSEAVLERIEAAKRDDETIEEALERILQIDLDEDAVEAADVYHQTSNRWTVWDALIEQRRDDETLAETFRRVGEDYGY